jgi:DNA-binding transcriptional regulator YiaG
MKVSKSKELEAAGWKVGSAREFVGMSEEEAAFVELKLTLSASLKECRTSQGLSQSEFAKRLDSSQSRVAKMEASDPVVSVDLLIRALFSAGATRNDIAKAIAKSGSLAA